MKIIGHTGSYAAGVAMAERLYPGRWHSVQHNGQGWQSHKWCVIVEVACPK